MKTYKGYSDQGDATGPTSVLVYEEGHETYRLRHMRERCRLLAKN